MNFTLTIPTSWNYTPAELMHKYAQSTHGATFVRDIYSTAYICKNCVWYVYDHLKTEQTDTPDQIKVTVFLKEKTL